MTMRTLVGITIAAVLVAIAGCGDNNNGNPPPPAISKVQIDRMGRAGVNTALTNPFFRESVESEKSNHEQIVDAYNAETDKIGRAHV